MVGRAGRERDAGFLLLTELLFQLNRKKAVIPWLSVQKTFLVVLNIRYEILAPSKSWTRLQEIKYSYLT